MTPRLFPSKRAVRLALRGFGLLLLVLLSARLVWRASRTETGFQTLQTQWRDATVGWFLRAPEPIDSRPPEEQADFWLGETERVLAAHPADARLAMGAAVVLDRPGNGLVWRHMILLAFEQRCSKRCLELAATAARLEPANAEWWQLYALLLARDPFYHRNDSPRDPEWLDILDECARHDPNNALYDYLAARFYWDSAAEMDYSGAEDRLIVKDAETFQRGVARFEQGQARQYLRIGDAGLTVAAEFLAKTRLPLVDQERIVNSRGIASRRSFFLRDVMRWLCPRATEKAAKGDAAGALALTRQSLQVISQYETHTPGASFDPVVMDAKAATVWEMQTLVAQHSEAIDDSQKRKLAALESAVWLEYNVINEACSRWAARKAAPPGGSVGTPDSAILVKSLFVGIATPLVTLLLLVGLVAFFLSRWLAGGERPAVGLSGQASALLVAVAATVTFLGLAPAGIISRQIQEWFFTAGLLLLPLGLAAGIGWCWLRGYRFQFSLRTLFFVTLLVSLLCSFVAVAGPEANAFEIFPFYLSIAARGDGDLNASIVGDAVVAHYGKWLWAVYQWLAYRGPYVTVALWAVLLGALDGVKMRKLRRLSSLLRSFGRPAMVLAVLLLIGYLCLAPAVFDRVERDFQEKIAFARDPQAYWAEVEEIVQQVRSERGKLDASAEDAEAAASAPDSPE